MAKSISHTVTRPGRKQGQPDVEIPVAEDLASVPGVPQNPVDVAFYSREFPLETQAIEKSADRQWALKTYPEDMSDFLDGHDARMKPMYEEGLVSADVEPTGAPVAGEDLTEDIRGSREIWDSEKWASPGTTDTIRSRARSAGRSSSTPSAWLTSRTTA